MMISPGARKVRNGTSPTMRVERPSARVKTARNSKVVTMGATTVCAGTFMKRMTSLAYRVLTPIQLTVPIRRRDASMIRPFLCCAVPVRAPVRYRFCS